MDREVEQGATAQHVTGKNTGHAAGRADKLEIRAQHVHGPLREKLRQGAADKGIRVQLEQLRHIGRDVLDQKIKGCRYQAAIALHAAEQMDGLAVTIGQIGLGDVGHRFRYLLRCPVCDERLAASISGRKEIENALSVTGDRTRPSAVKGHCGERATDLWPCRRGVWLRKIRAGGAHQRV